MGQTRRSDFQILLPLACLREFALNETVEDYLKLYTALKGIYNIEERTARYKIAGLMAACILKHCPIQLIDWSDDAAQRISMDNEEFALLDGLGICAEDCSPEQVTRFLTTPNLYQWQGDMVYLFKRRTDASECFSMIFATLCLSMFPENYCGDEE